MKVCVVVVTYNRLEVLLKTVDHILKQIHPVDYFVVVDNASNVDVGPPLKGKSGRIDLLKLADNQGYGAGLSMGMKYALSKFRDIDFFWLMDDDSLPKSELLNEILASRVKSGRPGIVSVTGFIDSLWHGPVRISMREASFELHAADHVLIDGALVDKSVVEVVGTPREDLFMMCEDVEYSKRIKRAGFGVFILPQESFMDRLHLGGGDGFTKNTVWRGYYHARNHLVIVKEYFSWRNLLGYTIRQLKYLIKGLTPSDRRKRVSLRLLGILHGVSGKMGKTIDPAKI